MRTKQRVIMAVTLLVWPGVVFCATLHRLNSLPQAKRELVVSWLTSDCIVSENAFAKQLSMSDSELELILWEAYKKGPPDEFLARMEAKIQQQYSDLQVEIERYGSLFCDQGAIDNLRAIKREEYRKRRLHDLVFNYKASALVGLGSVASPATIARLKQIANEKVNPFRVAAESALKIANKRN